MSEQRRPVDQRLAVVRHPSFCPELAPGIVDGSSWAELLEMWDLSSSILAGRVRPRVRAAQAALREAILGEMESRFPELYASWLPACSGS